MHGITYTLILIALPKIEREEDKDKENNGIAAVAAPRPASAKTATPREHVVVPFVVGVADVFVVALAYALNPDEKNVATREASIVSAATILSF